MDTAKIWEAQTDLERGKTAQSLVGIEAVVAEVAGESLNMVKIYTKFSEK